MGQSTFCVMWIRKYKKSQESAIGRSGEGGGGRCEMEIELYVGEVDSYKRIKLIPLVVVIIIAIAGIMF